MEPLAEDLERLASETRFSGVVRVDRRGHEPFVRAYGLACRRHRVPTEPATRFGIASGAKAFTALTVLRLVERAVLTLDAPVRSLLGRDLPLIDDRVTVEHLLAHRSGIGDYLEEEDADDDPDASLLPVPVHELATTEAYLRALDGFPMRFEPGTAFAYCNGGYVVLALVAERATGVPFHDLVHDLVCRPARLTDTAFDRSDDLPPEVATGYLGVDDDRTNVLHLPVRGSGDGGLVTTVADVHRFWLAFAGGTIVTPATVDLATRVHSRTPRGRHAYGLGFWLSPDASTWQLEGGDAGVSFRSRHRPADGVTWTVASNTTSGAWPIADRVADRVADQVADRTPTRTPAERTTARSTDPGHDGRGRAHEGPGPSGAAVLARVVKIVVGVVLVLAGIAMLVLPGPGLLAIAGGGALILSQWPRGQRFLASLRVRLRERYGSHRVRRVEAKLPDEVCPPAETTELRAIAAAPVEAVEASEAVGGPALGPPEGADPGSPTTGAGAPA